MAQKDIIGFHSYPFVFKNSWEHIHSNLLFKKLLLPVTETKTKTLETSCFFESQHAMVKFFFIFFFCFLKLNSGSFGSLTQILSTVTKLTFFGKLVFSFTYEEIWLPNSWTYRLKFQPSAPSLLLKLKGIWCRTRLVVSQASLSLVNDCGLGRETAAKVFNACVGTEPPRVKF